MCFTLEPLSTKVPSVNEDFWVFGYGSLIFRPGFEFEERIVGCVPGYERRFWQASVDHRGTPENPGRVVTLVPTAGGQCWGVAYRVKQAERAEVTTLLDEREKGGYSLVELPFAPKGKGARLSTVKVYLAEEGNPAFVGPEEEEVTASIIRDAAGPSGHNVEYLLRLAEALAELDIEDPHVIRLANLVIDPADVLLEG